MIPLDARSLAPAYHPIADLARHRSVSFHLAIHGRTPGLHLHLPDRSTISITDDGIGGAAARKPSGSTGWTVTRTLATGQHATVYDSTIFGPHHHLGTDIDPVLGVLHRYLPPAPSPRPASARRSSLLSRLLRLT
ncbi:hypothetical protein ACIQ9P_03745 [Kitasatospora sp. NPDC094019]|uniref:hypothetical protein n=1 Tax=Kitasatospora sp. NPDC094019 TaxID=3364091 RepID=UPI0037F20858